MKKVIILFIIFLSSFFANSQTCEEYMKFVKSESRGTTYTSYTSDAISKVTFYEVSADYQTYYFAIVCFKKEYSIQCSEYIYQVASSTKTNYAMNYLNSAGEAFWNYIQPYHKNLGCAPDFE
ncbi:hypothetical protein [Psychroflexus salis]|uniref:KTSC domain-containing protein n=1 Tax=Psychroflexus salis TaxID=1526574 RepID=A0A917E5M5_9FLAO|nr:hypothetical protein [Psychroflexus salis]GGE06904.1 hypothetical protein GCM10010831_05500 [Psychroflexus salis]